MQNERKRTNDDDSIDTPDDFPDGPLGSGVVRIVVDADTYTQLRDAYETAVEAGLDEPFDVFAENYTDIRAGEVEVAIAGDDPHGETTMTASETHADGPEANAQRQRAELIDGPEDGRWGHHAHLTVEIEVPPEVAVAAASRLGVEAVREETRELPADRADVWANDLIELRPTYTVDGPEGQVPLADYLNRRGVPVEATDDE
jgi:hypothetical protein